MESQPQNPEFRINPENFHPCTLQGVNNKGADQPVRMCASDPMQKNQIFS